MQNTLVHYVVERNRRAGCVVACKGDNGVVTLGWSKCIQRPSATQRAEGVKADKFSREYALKSARERATIGLNEAITQATAPKIPAICRAYLRRMADRARRYFKEM